MWGDHLLASLRRRHHISTAVRIGLAFLFLHLPRNDTISRILRMRIRRHIFLHRGVWCKCSFCQHRSGFCNYSTDRLKSWISVNTMFYIFVYKSLIATPAKSGPLEFPSEKSFLFFFCPRKGFRTHAHIVVLQFSFFASPQAKNDFWSDHPCGQRSKV